MKAEYLKDWDRLAHPEDFDHDPNAPPPDPKPEQWDRFCDLIWHVYSTGDLPQALPWSILACIPKSDGGRRGIGLLEIVWKVLEAIIDSRLKATITLHDAIHGFTAKRGTGTATTEVKLQMELAQIRQEPLFQVFLDLRKAYDTADRPRMLAILRGYGVGPHTLRLLENFWAQQQIVPRQSGFHGPVITASRGGTQGSLLFPMLFNILEDAILRHWLSLVIDDDGSVAQQGMGLTVADRLAAFYADDGLVSSTHHPWLQHATEVLVGLFRRVGLVTNVAKTKAMTTFPQAFVIEQSARACKRRVTGDGPSFREFQRQKVSCPTCGKPLARGSLQTHLRRVHGEELDPWLNELEPPATHPPCYKISFPRVLRKKACPVEGCHTQPTSPTNMRKHFMQKHPTATLCISEEGSNPLPAALDATCTSPMRPSTAITSPLPSVPPVPIGNANENWPNDSATPPPSPLR